MSISIGSDSLLTSTVSKSASTSSASKLEGTLSGGMTGATDDEMMDACKSFEAYLVEQMIESMRSTVSTDEDENEYEKYFGDMRYQEYAEQIADSGQMGIAQMLYDSMKRDE